MERKAVALKYPKNSFAPFITAKGTGLTAERILEVAKENEIPVRFDERVVDILNTKDIGESIPEETWEVLAVIFASIMDK